MERAMRSRIAPIKVGLAAVRQPVVDALEAGLATARGIKIVGEAHTALETLKLVSRGRPALLIVDLAIPPIGGLAILGGVRQRSPRTRVLVIDDKLNEQRALETAKEGGYGYMLADAVPVYLAKAIRCMGAGEAWFSRKLTASIVDEFYRLIRLHAHRGERREGPAPRR